MTKYRTREQTETGQERAVRFANDVLQDSDLSDELESLRPEEYASPRGIVIRNLVERKKNMAGNGMSKGDLEDCVDQATQILQGAYVPEASREFLATAIGDALDALGGDFDADDGDDDDGGQD